MVRSKDEALFFKPTTNNIVVAVVILYILLDFYRQLEMLLTKLKVSIKSNFKKGQFHPVYSFSYIKSKAELKGTVKSF